MKAVMASVYKLLIQFSRQAESQDSGNQSNYEGDVDLAIC
jgi:hypothetical protein